MRGLFVGLFMVAFVGLSPVVVMANTNQVTAEKIAMVLGERFPETDIAVSYQNGRVRLAGQVASPAVASQVATAVRGIEGIKVDAIDSGLTFDAQSRAPVQARQAMPMPPYAQGLGPVAIPGPESQTAMPVPNGRPMPIFPQGGSIAESQTAMPSGRPMPYPQGGPIVESLTAMPSGRPMPGQYNTPTMPEHAWPSYAAYPNYAEVSYPRQHAAGAWPFIGPYYPYPQVPLGWRKTSLEWHDGWWWLDFDDGSNQGPFSPVFRRPLRYTY